MQHNPNAATGKKGFVELFSKFAKPQPIMDTIKAPVVAIIAEGDLVVISFAANCQNLEIARKHILPPGRICFA